MLTTEFSGGHHPIAIEDVLGPTPELGYRIVHKLSYRCLACGSEGSHTLTLYFTLQGPNGIHFVLVTDVVVPLLRLVHFEYTQLWRKAACHGDLAQAVALNEPPSLPPYVVSPCNIAKYYTTIVSSEPQYPQTSLAMPMNRGRNPSLCVLEACAPEVVFARIVGKVDNPLVQLPADIWALGIAIYNIHLMLIWGLFALLCHAVVTAGSLPPEWQT